MIINKHPIDLGFALKDMRTSPIINNIYDEQDMTDPEIPEERTCYFNGNSYPHGTYIKSGTVILLCDRGAWVETDTPDEF